MFKRAKIICTIGPATKSKEQLSALIDAGMNVARINFSHGTHEEHLQTITMLQQIRDEKHVPLAIMLDTKGPEVRVDHVANDKISVKKGDQLHLVSDPNLIQGKLCITVTPLDILDAIEVDANILFDDGFISTKVIQKKKNELILEVENDGSIQTRKGVNVPGCELPIPSITEKDKEDLIFGAKHNIDLVAASFVCDAKHILDMKKLLADHGGHDIKVISKIESSLGVDNFSTILHVSDGIMVARGDLGVEVPIKQVPRLQKEMIAKSIQMAKPVFIATQMLQSMIDNPRPTRAEVSDVANAIYDGATAVMLSGETAVGNFPIEVVKMMSSIINETETDFNYDQFFHRQASSDFFDISSSIAVACVKTSHSSGAKAIFVCTSSGKTARIMSRFKPTIPIFALTSSKKVYHQMAMHWGVIPIYGKVENNRDAIHYISSVALERHMLEYGDLIIISSGAPFGISGTTNAMIMENIGEVLVRGKPVEGLVVYGKVAILLSHNEQEKEHIDGCIVVTTKLEQSYIHLFKDCIGIVLQNTLEDIQSEEVALEFCKEHNIPLLLRADGATEMLKEGELITLDPTKGLIFKGQYQSHKGSTHEYCDIKKPS